MKGKSCPKNVFTWELAASTSLEDSGLSKSWCMEESEAKIWLLFPINLNRKQGFLSSPSLTAKYDDRGHCRCQKMSSYWSFKLQALWLSAGGRSQVCLVWKVETSRYPERCNAQIPEEAEEADVQPLKGYKEVQQAGLFSQPSSIFSSLGIEMDSCAIPL